MYIDTQLQYTAICKKYMTLEMRKLRKWLSYDISRFRWTMIVFVSMALETIKAAVSQQVKAVPIADM